MLVHLKKIRLNIQNCHVLVFGIEWYLKKAVFREYQIEIHEGFIFENKYRDQAMK